jgi:hypothetical protein
MKSITFLIAVFLVMGLSAAHAQSKRTRDLLFPDYSKDVIKLKAAEPKPAEATISSPQALRARIFKAGNSGGAPSATPVVNKETKELSSSKSHADAVKELKQAAAAQAKIVAPKPDQATEPQPKPKN